MKTKIFKTTAKKGKILILDSFTECDAIGWVGGWVGGALRVHSSLPCLTEKKTEAQPCQIAWQLVIGTVKY